MLRLFSGYSESALSRYQLMAEEREQRPMLPNWGEHGGVVAPIILVICSALLWALSLEHIDLRQMDDTGLVSVLPLSVLLALGLLNVSFCMTISQRTLSVRLVWLHIVVLVVMLYGITAIVQEEPRFAIGWKLSGIIDYIIQTGTVDGRIDAFFNWPTFFILMAFITEVTGLGTAVSFMAWAPVGFNLLYLGPLWMIYRSGTTDMRLVSLSAWFFLIANWIGQDYLSPQAFNFFLFLVVLAIVLTWMRGPAWPAERIVGHVAARVRGLSPWLAHIVGKVERLLAGEEAAVTPSTPHQRAAFIVIFALIFMAMVSSHQLTPFALLAALGTLVFFNRFSALTIPILLAVMIATWVLYMATPYVHGHIEHIATPVGSVGTNIDANLSERFRGSEGHIFINYMRTGMSLAVWALAFWGLLRRFFNGHRDWALALVAATPFPLLALQAYGGELLLRIYLYSVPFMAFFCAAIYFPTPSHGRRWQASILLFVGTFAMLVSFLFTRYGNERMMTFTSEEVAAVRYLYEMAEPGSQFVAVTGTLPWRFQDYRTYKYTTIPPRLTRLTDVQSIIGIMANDRFPDSYLIVTRSQQASGELFIGWPPEVWDQLIHALHESQKLDVIYQNQDATIYVLDKSCSGADAEIVGCGTVD
jgi:hypothetical protein